MLDSTIKSSKKHIYSGMQYTVYTVYSIYLYDYEILMDYININIEIDKPLKDKLIKIKQQTKLYVGKKFSLFIPTEATLKKQYL